MIPKKQPEWILGWITTNLAYDPGDRYLHLGVFDNLQDAAAAYKDAAERYHDPEFLRIP
jgi:hypothetical protein